MQYEIQGKVFTLPEKITNRKVIQATEINDSEDPWFTSASLIDKMMRTVLDGPHDEVDWLDEEIETCLEAVRDFFLAYNVKVQKLINSSGTN